MDVRSRRARESSPDRAKVCIRPRVKPIKRVQVVYYISRNGQLEHPHYMEVTHSTNQPLRLRDVIDRLTALRGKGMPSLYSWSCKRSYKNGYVWNDLAEDDIIYPAEGAEYVLKGSELVEGCSESFRQVIEEPKRKPVDLIRNRGRIETEKARYIEEQEYEVEEEYEDEEKTSFTSSTTTNSRCSRGVSTDEPEDQETHQNPTESTHRDSPPPSESAKIFDKPKCRSTNTSKRFEDGDPATTGSEPGRNSVLLQLIACGNFAGNKGKTVANPKQPVLKNTVIRTSSDLQKGVLRKTAMKVVEEEMMINCISENPRFGSLQSEEKEYFSGSIVESMSDDRVLTEPSLKRSNSYNEERSVVAGLGEIRVAEETNKVDKAVRAKCIPMKKPSSSSRQNKK